MNLSRTILSNSPDETQAAAASFFQQLQPGAVVALHGTLGAGKTCFAQGLALAAGVREPVCSPTYTIVSEHEGTVPFHHIDFYRLGGPEDVLDLGIEELLERGGITVIEWAERAGDLLPESAIHVLLEHGESKQQRRIHISSTGESNASFGH